MDGRIVALGIRDLKFRGAMATEWLVDVPGLDLQRGEQMLLTGGPASGKSTLLHLIAGFIEPARGRLFVAGAEMTALRRTGRDLHRARTIGCIFSTPSMLAGFSAVENVMAALMFAEIPRREHQARAEQLLRRCGIEHPDAIAEQMSMSERQRVAVARAMVCDPVLVLADEPTAPLESEDAAIAMDMLQSICREKDAALLCMSRERSMSRGFDRCASTSDLAALVVDGEEGL